MNLFDETKQEPIAMNRIQLANLYKVCPRTLNKWLRPYLTEIGTTEGTNIFTPAQVKTIFDKIGEP